VKERTQQWGGGREEVRVGGSIMLRFHPPPHPPPPPPPPTLSSSSRNSKTGAVEATRKRESVVGREGLGVGVLGAGGGGVRGETTPTLRVCARTELQGRPKALGVGMGGEK
jgi:hypothetical protein